jgi:hypothetical protein
VRATRGLRVYITVDWNEYFIFAMQVKRFKEYGQFCTYENPRVLLNEEDPYYEEWRSFLEDLGKK